MIGTRQRAYGLAVMILGALLLIVAFSGGIPFLQGSGGRTVTARFAQANELDDSTPVRIHGVNVGTVSTLKAAPDHTTNVVMKIATAGVQLHSDATATIRWRTLLGGAMYVDLDPGSASAPILDGTIPLRQTSSQVDWDQFNEQFPADTRTDFGEMFRGLATGLSAAGPEQATIQNLGPASQTIGQASQALQGVDANDLPAVVRSTASVLNAVSANTTALRQLVDDGDQTLSVTAAHGTELGEAMQLSPAALDATRRASGELNTMLNSLDPLVAKLEPGARELGPATTVLAPMLRGTDKLLTDSRRLIDEAPSTLAEVGDTGGQGTPLINGLTPTVERTNSQLVPMLNAYDPDSRLRLYETIGPAASSLADSLATFDANNNIYNFNLEMSAGSLILPCNTGAGGSGALGCIVSTGLSNLGLSNASKLPSLSSTNPAEQRK